MAFGLQYLSKCEMTQDFNQVLNVRSGQVLVANNLQIWTYNAQAVGGSNDTTVATQAANYFNGANGYLKVGDTIIVQSNNPAWHILNVTVNAAGVVTVAQAL